MPLTISEEVFWSRKTVGNNGCWNWTHSRNRCGYGTLNYKRKHWLAHRLAYYLKHGQIINHVLHSCDNPLCINPSHLRDGTHQENMTDKSIRGRVVSRNREKTHCIQGHELSGANMRISNGKRVCRTCVRDSSRVYSRRKRNNELTITSR